jgi:uncharacterized protein
MPLIVQIKVTPASGKHKWVIDKSGILKCFLKSPAQDGRANAELIKTIAKMLKLNAQRVSIIAGQTTRIKRVNIDADISLAQFIAALGIEQQKQLTFL